MPLYVSFTGKSLNTKWMHCAGVKETQGQSSVCPCGAAGHCYASLCCLFLPFCFHSCGQPKTSNFSSCHPFSNYNTDLWHWFHGPLLPLFRWVPLRKEISETHHSEISIDSCLQVCPQMAEGQSNGQNRAGHLVLGQMQAAGAELFLQLDWQLR